MGAADIVPGVSGGTVALVLGHYQRLVTAISSVDSTLVHLIAQRRFRDAANHVDLRFLVALGAGIALGVVTLAGMMHWLLEEKTPETLAVFFGLIVASLWIVKGYVDRWDVPRLVALAMGTLVAAGICLLPASSGSMSLPFLFMSASIAICAMILPGISGAFVLLLFGVYHSVTGLIKDAAHGHVTAESMLQIAVFGAGCAFGLLAFSRLLRWLLEHRRATTMAALMGLMVGSVGRLWPLQLPTPETADLELKYRVMRYVWPADWPGSIASLVLLAIGAALIVLVVEQIAARLESPA